MSIIEGAIERAKRTFEDQARGSNKPRLSSGVPEPRRLELEERGERGVVRINVPRMDIDESRCRANRILIPSTRDGYTSVFDAYRMVRTRIMSRMDRNGWRSLAVTSVGPDEGKSVTALNLGLTLATEQRRNVFLVDLDLRNPSLCQYIGATPRAEIAEFLAGRANAEELFGSVVTENLMLAGGCTRHEHSAELLGTPQLGQLFAYISSLDPDALVLADLPPVLSVADALIVAPKVSATMLVIAEGKTRRDGLARALQTLSAATIAGVVLNQSRETLKDYYG